PRASSGSFNETAYGSEVCACVDVFYSAVQCG
ncbi:MAG: hypothetical protein JWQ60_3372, partial [Pseudonocardia sp.]|nr:hypothetical protein [Pseudonocardia sp.]